MAKGIRHYQRFAKYRMVKRQPELRLAELFEEPASSITSMLDTVQRQDSAQSIHKYKLSMNL